MAGDVHKTAWRVRPRLRGGWALLLFVLVLGLRPGDAPAGLTNMRLESLSESRETLEREALKMVLQEDIPGPFDPKTGAYEELHREYGLGSDLESPVDYWFLVLGQAGWGVGSPFPRAWDRGPVLEGELVRDPNPQREALRRPLERELPVPSVESRPQREQGAEEPEREGPERGVRPRAPTVGEESAPGPGVSEEEEGSGQVSEETSVADRFGGMGSFSRSFKDIFKAVFFVVVLLALIALGIYGFLPLRTGLFLGILVIVIFWDPLESLFFLLVALLFVISSFVLG